MGSDFADMVKTKVAMMLRYVLQSFQFVEAKPAIYYIFGERHSLSKLISLQKVLFFPN